MNVHIIIGARPNLMKVAPIYRAFQLSGEIDSQLIDTGQHFNKNMSDVFYDEFNLPQPNYRLGVGSGTHAVQTAKIMIGYDKVCLERKPDWTVVVGDVNSTLACAITAAKRGIRVAHLEAGLRSRDMSMPEEINRIVTDSVSSLMWTPSEDASRNLLNEGHPTSKIDLVGNVMIDCLEMMRPRFSKRRFWESLGLEEGKYCLMTFHRPSNVDDTDNIIRITEQILGISKNIPVVFPVHPRTFKAMKQTRMLDKLTKVKDVTLLEPLGYVDFMSLMSSASFVVSDSGGIQEETAYLGIPCFTVRTSTERPITLSMGTNVLIDISEISRFALNQNYQRSVVKKPKFWDGKTAQRVTESLLKNH